MILRAFLVGSGYYLMAVLAATISLSPPDTPAVPVNELNAAPDASTPEPPEPAGDCGDWYDEEECDV